MKTELFENADVTASIYYPSEHALGSLRITRGQRACACLFSFIEVRMSNIVIEYRFLLLNSEFQMSQRFRVDGHIFKNGFQVDADLFYTFYTDKKDASSKGSGYVWAGSKLKVRSMFQKVPIFLACLITFVAIISAC